MSQFLCISPNFFLSPSTAHMKSYLEKWTLKYYLGKKKCFHLLHRFEKKKNNNWRKIRKRIGNLKYYLGKTFFWPVTQIWKKKNMNLKYYPCL